MARDGPQRDKKNAIWRHFNAITIGHLPRGEEEKLVSSKCDESDILANEDERLDD